MRGRTNPGHVWRHGSRSFQAVDCEWRKSADIEQRLPVAAKLKRVLQGELAENQINNKIQRVNGGLQLTGGSF